MRSAKSSASPSSPCLTDHSCLTTTTTCSPSTAKAGGSGLTFTKRNKRKASFAFSLHVFNLFCRCRWKQEESALRQPVGVYSLWWEREKAREDQGYPSHNSIFWPATLGCQIISHMCSLITSIGERDTAPLSMKLRSSRFLLREMINLSW